MRYGGYVLVALPFLIFTSYKLQKLEIETDKIKLITSILLIIAIVTYIGRNISRLNKEVDFYKYNLLASPFFYVEKVKTKKIFDDGTFKIYSPPNDVQCWAAKTPCSYYKKIKVKKILNFNIVYRDDR